MSHKAKVATGLLKCPPLAIRMFCGLPTGLIMLPTVTVAHSAISSGIGRQAQRPRQHQHDRRADDGGGVVGQHRRAKRRDHDENEQRDTWMLHAGDTVADCVRDAAVVER